MTAEASVRLRFWWRTWHLWEAVEAERGGQKRGRGGLSAAPFLAADVAGRGGSWGYL
jgi:hypothetical protein